MVANITIYKQRPKFFQPVPVDSIMEAFEEAFKRTNLKGYDDEVTIEALCRVFKEVGDWCSSVLRSGDFVYGIRYSVDQNRELFLWEYLIAGPNMPVRFLVHEARLDAKRDYTLTVKNCMCGIHHHLQKANEKVEEFNRLVECFKPTLPPFNQKELLELLMRHTQVYMEEFYRRKYNESPTSYVLRKTPFEAWVLSEGIKDTRHKTLNSHCRILFDVFDMTHVGWSQVKVSYEFRDLGMRFVVLEEDINLYGRVEGAQIVDALKKMIKTADASVRRWNWLLEGGHNKASKVKNQFNTKRNTGGWGWEDEENW
jgi:hypothetical protein